MNDLLPDLYERKSARMRLLVVSDSHGDSCALYRAIQQQPAAQVVIHLGDGENDMEQAMGLCGEKRVICVRGNCDWGSMLPALSLERIAGKLLYLTHGYAENVKYGDGQLRQQARACKADIALYGHTHRAVTDFEDGLYLMNPGAVANGEYGIVDITQAGIVCVNHKIR